MCDAIFICMLSSEERIFDLHFSCYRSDVILLYSLENGKGSKKKKAKKDPNAPKKPLSAYMLWLQEMRPTLKKKYPSASITELSKKAGEHWKGITDKSVRWCTVEIKSTCGHGWVCCRNGKQKHVVQRQDTLSR